MKPNSSKIEDKHPLPSTLVNRAMLTILVVLLIDQISKVWVKTHMYLDESISVFGDWFYIHFIENPGMAFGFEFGGETGKLVLSIFRIVAVFFIGAYLRSIIKQRCHVGLIIAVSLVLAGAIGNIIDSVFYGMLFSESPRFSPETAILFPPEGGYAGLLHGKVVDMLYFPLIDGYWPEKIPVIGGNHFQFFRPVFNVADSAITIGMALVLINQKRYFAPSAKKEEAQTEVVSTDQVQAEQNRK